MPSDLTTHPPHRVRPVMRHTWAELTFVHWSLPPRQLRPLLPESLELDTFEGQAWVGVTPFRLSVQPPAPRLPPFPGMNRVPETNLRTYVRDRRGRHGIWFFSLDIARVAAAAIARATYGLPYRWAEMSILRERDKIRYEGVRKPPEQAGYRIAVEIGPTDEPVDARDELVDFLTARWRLYTVISGRLFQARVQHPPWPLRKSRLSAVEHSLFQAAGLPAPKGEPLVHFSPGVDVLVGPPLPVRA